MKDKQFDRIIREKLERLEAGPDPGSWELFEQQLDGEVSGTPETEDRVLDQILFNRLHRLEEPYNSRHWRQLSVQLDRTFFLERTLLRYKLMELVFLLLAVFTLFNFFMPVPEPVLTPPSQEKAAEHKGDQPAQAGLLPPDDQQGEEARGSKPAAAGSEGNTASATQSTTPAGSEKADSSVDGGESAMRENNAAASKRTGAGAQTLPGITPGWQRRSLLAAKPLPRPEVGLVLNHIDHLGLTHIRTLDPTPLAHQVEAALTLPVGSSPRKRQMFVSMFGALEYNRIQTPAEELNGGRVLPALDRYSLDYGGGITLAFEMGRWEVETGAIYSAKVYRPRQVLYLLGNIKGYYGEGLKDIELNVLQVPLNVRYHFLRHNNWRAYALAGLSVQVAFQANYYVADQNGFDDVPFLAPPGEGDSQVQESSLDRRNLSGGWFEGGTFEENGYLTGNLGFGLERYLSPRWSLFAQPTYQYSLDYFIQGLGPYKDRIHTMSIYTGLRVRM